MENARMYTDGRGPTRVGHLQLSGTVRKGGHAQRRATSVAMTLVTGVAAVALWAGLAGCAPGPKHSDVAVGAFDEAGPVKLNIDYKQVLQIRKSTGPYRLVAGDLLELQMPAIVSLLPEREGDDTEPYRCRLDRSGQVVLPIIGNMKVAGKTLSEVEALVAEGYHPKYVRQKPSIVASVVEYHLSSVTMVGALKVPGTYGLRSNEMTLIAAIMKAGGITDEGATSIHISGPSSDEKRPLVVPVLDMNIPSRDAKLTEGDTVIIEAMEPQAISVVGLVKKPGMYPWKPKSRCTLMDALAFAGGLNELADPRYARVYRQDADGKIVSAVVKLTGSTAAGELYLKPGDIIDVVQTPRTQTRLILSQIVRMGLGVNAGATVGP